MKVFGAGLADHLEQDSTTLCYCWRIERKDGLVLGFTDHDSDIVVDSETYLATTGITTTKIVRRLGLAVDNLEIEGVIDDNSLTTLDIELGLYDGAKVEILYVDWSNPLNFDRMAVGSFGNARMSENGFEVEFRSLSQRLNQPTGLTYQRSCSAKLGDSRCGYQVVPVSTTVQSVSGHVLTVSNTPNPKNWFSLGSLLDAAGVRHKVKSHSGTQIVLWERPVVPLVVGSTVILSPGCGQLLSVCRDKFGNSVNFRGFPHMPGNDALNKYPVKGRDKYNGKSLFR
jgi:uncharacterized phage protein (TIGR02218 family)